MKLHKQVLLLSVLALASTQAFAQVEKVAMKTTGISCGTCAAVSEIYLRRLAGIDTIKISMSNEAIMVSYKPGAAFQPRDIRDALKKTEVGVVQFQVSVRGRVQDQGGKRFFIAGKDKFVLTPAANAPQVPSDTPVLIEATLNDNANPMELRVMTFKPIK
jgi:copper chaperone CopZ